jgi:hypothetical protein
MTGTVRQNIKRNGFAELHCRAGNAQHTVRHVSFKTVVYFKIRQSSPGLNKLTKHRSRASSFSEVRESQTGMDSLRWVFRKTLTITYYRAQNRCYVTIARWADILGPFLGNG